MDKKDFRVQFPLWNIALFLIFMVWSYSLVYCTDLLAYYYGNLFGVEELVQPETIYPIAVTSFIAGPILLIVFFSAYSIQVKKHNQRHPHNKITALSLFRPVEFIDVDELFSQVTKNATKKVYIYYANVLPLFIAFMFFPVDRYVYIVVLLLILIIQNGLYYREIRKYIDSKGDTSKGVDWEQKMTKRYIWGFVSLALIALLVLTTIIFVKEEQQQQNTLDAMEACLNNNQTAVVEGGLFTPTKVTCE